MKRLLVLPLLLFLASSAWAGRAVVRWKGGVNVRASPRISGKLVGKLSAGAEAETSATRRGWVRVRYSGGEGWVARRSLRMLPDRPPRKTAAETPPHEEHRPPAPAPAAPVASPPPAAPKVQVAEAPPAAPKSPPSTGEGYLSGYDRQTAPATVDTGPSLFTVVSALLLVLALVAGVVYLIKVLSGRRYLGSQKAKGIQVLATRPLGPRQSLVLVEVAGVLLLLAQGEAGINLIAEIRDPEALRKLNDLYGFRETPFEAELHRRLDLESEESGDAAGEEPQDGPTPDVAPPRPDFELGAPEPGPQERLAALRRRRKAGEEP